VAVAPDGSAAFVAWYDPAHGDLLLGAYEEVEGLALARPTGLASPGASPTSPPPTSPSPQPTGSPTGGPAPGECPPDGVRITASPGAVTNGFDQTELTVPAGEPFTVCFDNQDTGIPHNWALYTDESASEKLAEAGSFPNDPPAPVMLIAEVAPLDPGSYFFRCDYHPTTMTGTLTAK
jgi:plastocyanin